MYQGGVELEGKRNFNLSFYLLFNLKHFFPFLLSTDVLCKVYRTKYKFLSFLNCFILKLSW